MKRLLVTGSNGFVAKHLIPACAGEYQVFGISRTASLGSIAVEMLNFNELRKVISDIEPDYVIHLASQSSVEQSWRSPSDSFMNNTCIFLNLIDAIRLLDFNPRILSVGSSEQYGIVSQSDLPLKETHPANPTSPYAIARMAQEQLSTLFVSGYGMDIVCTRSFNHCGANQDDRFVIPSIVKQFRRIQSGLQPKVVAVGNKKIIRDFIDVLDVVEAYKLLLDHSRSGSIYNVCSGHGRSIEVIIKMISENFGIDVDILENITTTRPIDNPTIVGCNDKIKSELGWEPKIPFEQSLKDICKEI
jgi:GDP-4-dehydro-6-deoxy-D-mannose reductase